MTYNITNKIHFYKSFPNIVSIEFNLGYPVYVSDSQDFTPSNLALLGRDNGRWFMYSNGFKKGGIELERKGIQNSQNQKFKNYRNDGSMIEYYPPMELDSILNQISSLSGTMIQHEAILKQEGFTIFIETVDRSLEPTLDLIRNVKDSINIIINVNKVPEEEMEIPQCIEFLKQNGDYDDLELIKTIWKMRRVELMNDIAGIFLNEGTFRPKYFDSVSANLIGNIKGETVKGRSNFTLYYKKNNEQAVEFEVSSYWFGDFFRNVIRTYMGSFYYWSYSDGKGTLENYFIINGKMKSEFLSGLLSHWKEPRRIKHHNYIEYIKKLKKIVSP